ncbi:MAG: 2Fe-2S iron-sulfur cluster binding domain-containing protein [Marinobacter sp.]|uniref:2Fe-2S iron-sulfur cluster-binding protein n=1 Tax=Marinobacter sp. TaxID=50741 RepID=UPI001B56541B|nr:2Fe-2S iron-sulfur cluster-binding protein [Marinobacter sp.]MBQ0747621.1 2Fe-2S iron-sulfur cluster binding domain-containing protein [Marinobacter sp.]MBQ0813789.1 2Fe-2S iron-sulfur cluster binding domain-containing protein [Marinobacter sp.]|tara:strand:- start:6092 stop:7096 length:1005 start_codon:yes stop_codon:yes gene_type:complete
MGNKRWRVCFEPSGVQFFAAADADLLSAAASAGIAVPFACKNGVCELCEARLLSGTALNTRNQQMIPVGARLMMCRTAALDHLELEISAVMAAGNNQPRKFQANVVDVSSLNHDVYRVELQLPRRRELSFHAGQYLSVNLPDAEPCYFSIASSPTEQNIELHIQASPEWLSAQKVIDALTSGESVNLELPHGKACLVCAPEKPLLLVAAGTGFAQMKSLVDYLRGTSFAQPVKLFWGARRHEDMYLRSMALQWEQDLPGFTFQPVVGGDEDSEWSGHHDQLVRAVLASGMDWSNVEVHASGSPTMVYTLMDALVDAGLPPEAFLSDVLEYAPRS